MVWQLLRRMDIAVLAIDDFARSLAGILTVNYDVDRAAAVPTRAKSLFNAIGCMRGRSAM